MNYYQHHIGDYLVETSHLTFLEDAAYSRLLRLYYHREAPFPADVAVAQRLSGARSKAEKVAVEVVLGEFFTLQDDGWHNLRADEEISAYREKQGKAKAAIDARWGKTKEHAPEDTDAQDLNAGQDTHDQRTKYARNTDVLPAKYARNTNQEPRTINQEPLTKNQEPDLTALTTGTSPVVEGAQARATPQANPPVDNFSQPQGLATVQGDEPEKSATAGEPERAAALAKSDKPPRADRAKPVPKSGYGTRLPEGWNLPKSWGEWALGERTDLTEADVRREAACFADHWHAKAGIAALKADWEAAWRNWIRKAEEFRRQKNRILPAARASPVASAPNADAQWIRPQSEQAFDAAYEKLFGVTIDAAV